MRMRCRISAGGIAGPFTTSAIMSNALWYAAAAMRAISASGFFGNERRRFSSVSALRNRQTRYTSRYRTSVNAYNTRNGRRDSNLSTSMPVASGYGGGGGGRGGYSQEDAVGAGGGGGSES